MKMSLGGRYLRGSNGPHPDGADHHRRRRRSKKRVGPLQSQAELFKAAQQDNAEKCQEAFDNGARVFKSRVLACTEWGPCRKDRVKPHSAEHSCILDLSARNGAGNTAEKLAPFYNMGYLFGTDLSVPIMTSVTESKNPPAVPYASVESYPVPEAYAVPVSDMHVTTNVRSSLNLFSSASRYNILGNYRYSTDQYIHNQWNTQPVVVGQAVSMGSSSYYGGPAYVGNSTGGNSVVNSSSGAYASSGAPSANDVDNYSTQECYRRSNRNYR